MAIYELDPVDRIGITAVGSPGQRRFFLMATGSGRTMTLACEKSQIQALILRLHQMLEAQQIEAQEQALLDASPEPGEPEWQIGEMGLGYHEARRTFVPVGSEAAVGESPAATAGSHAPIAPVVLLHDQLAALLKQ